jgi:hypothetical protein
MATDTTVPVRVEAEAAARVQKLGLQREFEAMLEHTRQTVPNLREIEATLYRDPDDPEAPRVIITAWKNGPGAPDDPTERDWDAWEVRNFPPDVFRWFSFNALSWDDYGR